MRIDFAYTLGAELVSVASLRSEARAQLCEDLGIAQSELARRAILIVSLELSHEEMEVCVREGNYDNLLCSSRSTYQRRAHASLLIPGLVTLLVPHLLVQSTRTCVVGTFLSRLLRKLNDIHSKDWTSAHAKMPHSSELITLHVTERLPSPVRQRPYSPPLKPNTPPMAASAIAREGRPPRPKSSNVIQHSLDVSNSCTAASRRPGERSVSSSFSRRANGASVASLDATRTAYERECVGREDAAEEARRRARGAWCSSVAEEQNDMEDVGRFIFVLGSRLDEKFLAPYETGDHDALPSVMSPPHKSNIANPGVSARRLVRSDTIPSPPQSVAMIGKLSPSLVIKGSG